MRRGNEREKKRERKERQRERRYTENEFVKVGYDEGEKTSP